MWLTTNAFDVENSKRHSMMRHEMIPSLRSPLFKMKYGVEVRPGYRITQVVHTQRNEP